MQTKKMITALTLFAIGNVAMLQATPTQQRDFMNTVGSTYPSSNEFNDLTSKLHDTASKVTRLNFIFTFPVF